MAEYIAEKWRLWASRRSPLAWLSFAYDIPFIVWIYFGGAFTGLMYLVAALVLGTTMAYGQGEALIHAETSTELLKEIGVAGFIVVICLAMMFNYLKGKKDESGETLPRPLCIAQSALDLWELRMVNIIVKSAAEVMKPVVEQLHEANRIQSEMLREVLNNQNDIKLGLARADRIRE